MPIRQDATAPSVSSGAEVVLYIAASVDGFIARRDGSVDWLHPFDDVDYGYDAFLEGVGGVVMGRRSYEQILGYDPWPYAGKRVVVLSGSATGVPPTPDTEYRRGDVPALVEELKQTSPGDIWLLGGAKTARAFFDAGLVDRIMLFVIPVLLGDGVRLFPPASSVMARLAFVRAETYPNGVVLLEYELGRNPA